MGEFVHVEAEGGVATIRLDRPPMNALNSQMSGEIADAAAQVSADSDVAAVVLYGGDKVFAAGADVKQMAEAGHIQITGISDRIQAAFALAARFVGGPALALRAAKQAIDTGLDVDLNAGLEIERLQFAALFATEDQQTGMRSFIENGPGKATFSGR